MESGTFIHQSKYTKELLKKFEIENCKSVGTPMCTSTKLDKDKKGNSVDEKHYRGMIRTLLYLTVNKPNILFVVCLCA